MAYRYRVALARLKKYSPDADVRKPRMRQVGQAADTDGFNLRL